MFNKTIRHAVFETNSSSSHSLTISKKALMPPVVSRTQARTGRIFTDHRGEFGWEWKRYYVFANKLRYITTASLLHHDLRPYVDPEFEMEQLAAEFPRFRTLRDVVREHTGCELIVQPGNGTIDHESAHLLDDIFRDSSKLATLLFNPDSYIETGNDNSSPPFRIDTDRLCGTEPYYVEQLVKRSPRGKLFVGAQLFVFRSSFSGISFGINKHIGFKDPLYGRIARESVIEKATCYCPYEIDAEDNTREVNFMRLMGLLGAQFRVLSTIDVRCKKPPIGDAPSADAVLDIRVPKSLRIELEAYWKTVA